MASDARDEVPLKPRPRRLTTGKVFLFCLALGLVLTTSYVFFVEPYLEIRWANHGPPVDPATISTPFVWPGLERPETISAAEAKLDDAALVIGIIVGNRSRAYHQKSLGSTMRHVINDLIDDVPVTVTYCDQANCVRTFTSAERGEPLRLGVGGLLQGKLLLHERGVFYRQEDGKALAPDRPDLPYQLFPHEVTTWKAWREAHPDTDVYVFEPPPTPPLDPADAAFPFLPGTKDKQP